MNSFTRFLAFVCIFSPLISFGCKSPDVGSDVGHLDACLGCEEEDDSDSAGGGSQDLREDGGSANAGSDPIGEAGSEDVPVLPETGGTAGSDNASGSSGSVPIDVPSTGSTNSGGGQTVDPEDECDDLDLTRCDGVCVYTKGDAENCGSCGNACGDFEKCYEGECGCDWHLSTSIEQCGDACVDLDTDANNCGACGNVCPFGCFYGTCATPVKADAGRAHACMIASDGGLWCWGDNSSNQLGLIAGNAYRTAQRVPGIAGAIDVVAGSDHTCVIADLDDTYDFAVYCWGKNDVGQLGIGSASDTPVSTPTRVEGLDSGLDPNNFNVLTAGATGTCVILEDRTAWCWGGNEFGENGDGTTEMATSPVAVVGLSSVGWISRAKSHACARGIGIDGASLYCWGSNESGQLGLLNGDAGINASTTPVSARYGASLLEASFGSESEFSCGRVDISTYDQEAYCWGANPDGVLGTHPSNFTWEPATATTDAKTVREIATGTRHVCMVSGYGGDTLCWGNGEYGQLGNGSRDSAATPTLITDVWFGGLTAGDDFTCGVEFELGEDVYCWGKNDVGQLGNGLSDTSSAVPTPVAVGTD